MPYGRRSSFSKSRRHSSKSRNSASSTIARAWKRRNQRRKSLVSRTIQANRRACRKLARTVETKILSDTQATVGTLFGGQFNDNIRVDNAGQETVAAIPFFADIFRGMDVGSKINERIGAWVQMKSFTMKYCVSIETNGPAHYTLMLVHDQQPDGPAGVSALLDYTGAAPPPNNYLDLSFLNLDQVGSDGRFKVLWKKKMTLSLPATKVNGTAVPVMIQGAAAGDTMRPAYQPILVGQTSKSYPSQITSSVTLKLPYKINYGQTGSKVPTNQTVRLLAWCTPRSGFPQPSCRLQYYIRVRYKDA